MSLLSWFSSSRSSKSSTVATAEQIDTPEAESLLSQSQDEGEDGEISNDYTTKKEVFGWALYAWAAEPFIVSAVSTYVPLLLEQFARENGVRLDNHNQPCISLGEPLPPFLPPPTTNATDDLVSAFLFNRHTAQIPARNTSEPVKCVVYVLGKYIDTSSFALYTFSLSVLIQTLTVISMSGAADRGHYRKQLLIGFGLVGGLATMGFNFITSRRYYISAILAMVANSAFGAVNVCGNAFLPVLVSHTKKLAIEDSDLSTRQTLITKLSGFGAASGYVSALLVQVLSMIIVIKTGSDTESIQKAIFFVGLWWFVFQFPLIFLLKSRPGPPLVLHNKENALVQYIKFGWKTLFVSIGHASVLKDVLIYLLGWFIVSDSITTINSAAVLFAKSELQMSTPKLVIVGMLTVIFAIVGSIAIPQLQSYYRITSRNLLLMIIVWASVIPLYGLLGFYFDVVGLKHVGEMYLLAVWYGVSMGGLATVSRSLFSLLIPKGKESTFFSLYSVTDKGSSILGPTITALITDKTHNIRYTFYFLFFLLLLSIPVFLLLDIQRGQKDAEELEQI